MDTKNVVIAIILGIIAGWLASWIVGGHGLVQYLISGVLGSFVGSFLLQKAGINLGIRNEIGRDIATATIGAVVVMIIARILS
ncbi:GlsB/YeaQ/YmgE family stress response membrane protein [Aestuariivirga litoralis]|uniref:GlsB/YeaQ/YmgE family stress response membrane protein n=1 Tax=Aestuariivirga litoralis TaxID=2650924 RepID=UPI0018C6B7C6|nr:GlsB/YeaQ/YmgE family stress response membrane protein [Aestuariivirga litoralis]MBG1231562.1 GlsB/YeaQ/YmgE family stress response membrane protein [Aestuariivirga litoralis]